MGALRLEHRAATRDSEPRVTRPVSAGPFAIECANAPGPWLFLHVPKTAGSSVYSILRTLLKPPELLKLHPNGETLCRIRALPPPHRARIKVLYGHVDVHITRQVVPLQRCVTLLRDPVQRIVSYYAFARHMDRGAHSDLARRASITQWIDALRLPETDNGMVRRLSGALHEAAIGACTRQMLERAKVNLAQFAVVGLTDRFEEFYALLASRLRLPMRTYVAAKVNARRPRIDQLDRGTLAEIERRNALDVELYRFGGELFAQQLAKTDLSAAIDEFRRRCSREPLRLHDAVRRIAFARWKKLRRWSAYPFLG